MDAGARVAAVNVDVDSLYLYYRIHGLDESAASNAVWERGVVRFAELFDELGVSATFFVVGQDLERWSRAREIAAELVAAGHELASHSWSHPYDLTRRSPEEIARELDRAGDLLTEIRGTRVAGFRAPGYTMTETVWDLLGRRHYGYDSSLFPCPPYYLAKATVMAAMRLVGRESRSILDRPSVMWEPRTPHWRRGVLELPITVLPGLRLPFIGTSLLMMGQRGYRLVRPLLRRAGFVNLEFHAIDLCDRDLDGIDPALAARQPDLRVSLRDKQALFRRVIGDLRDDWGVHTLEAIAPLYTS